MSSDPKGLRALATALTAQSHRLWHAGSERRARWLAKGFSLLRDPQHPLGRRAHVELGHASGMDSKMVRWALNTALAPLTTEALLALDRQVVAPNRHALRTHPGQLCVVVLASNVFTAAARGVGLPLLFGWPVLAKPSSREDTFPRLLRAALCEADDQLGAAYNVVTFAAEQTSGHAALFEQADAVSVFGSDNTLNTIRAQLGATVTFIGHGHGLGAAFVGAQALTSTEDARDAARKLALDVAAYDQRGCLSPHVAWITRGAEVSPLAFAELLHEQLASLARDLPRGPLPFEVAAAQVSYRGLAAIHGKLLEGDGFAVCYEERASFRVSPGYRNLQLLCVDTLEELADRLAPLGMHLKCLGVAGLGDPAALLRAMPARVAPRICPLGTMQSPPVDALQDGAPPWEGLVRWLEVAPSDVAAPRPSF